MVKPSVLSVGIGIGVLMLGGSGIAIPTLWSRANRAEVRQDELQGSLRAAREARDAGEAALQAAEPQLAELQEQFETEREALAAALDSKQILTSQLAELQVHNRELMAASGTLKLRDQEMATLVQQLEQSRSDHSALLAKRDAATTSEAASDADEAASDADEAASDAANTAADAEATGDDAQPDSDTIAMDDLVPITPRGTMSAPESAPSKPQTTAKPAAATPIRFDDSGWKSVASSVSANRVNRPLVNDGTTIPSLVFPPPPYQTAPGTVIVP